MLNSLTYIEVEPKNQPTRGHTVGDPNPPIRYGSSLITSRKIHESTKGREKIFRAFSRTPHQFDIMVAADRKYLLNTSKTNNPTIGIVFTNNMADDGMPLTAWMMAHRMSHGLQYAHKYEKFVIPEIDIIKAIVHLYDSEATVRTYASIGAAITTKTGLDNFINDLLTMKSARDGKIGKRFAVDGFGELLAQYVIIGRVRFNQLHDYDHDRIVEIENRVNELLENMLTRMVGWSFGF